MQARFEAPLPKVPHNRGSWFAAIACDRKIASLGVELFAVNATADARQ